MAKIKYTVKENNRVGTHSFYAIPVPNGVLSFDELMEEACEDNTYDIDEMRGCVGRFMKAVQREVLRGWRCNLGKDFLVIYPNIEASAKDKDGVVATADMVNANGAKSRLGCTVHKKFSQKFAQEVSWTKVDANGAAIEDEDITQGNENVENNSQPVNTSPANPDNNDEPGGDDH